MQIKTKTAKRLQELIRLNHNHNGATFCDCIGLRKGIINFKNELKEIIKKRTENRLHAKSIISIEVIDDIVNLIQEIESVEK